VDSKKKRDTASIALREEMKNGSPKVEHRIYLSFPQPEDHTTHKIGLVKECKFIINN
jgi:hypothetical protein